MRLVGFLLRFAHCFICCEGSFRNAVEYSNRHQQEREVIFLSHNHNLPPLPRGQSWIYFNVIPQTTLS